MKSPVDGGKVKQPQLEIHSPLPIPSGGSPPSDRLDKDVGKLDGSQLTLGRHIHDLEITTMAGKGGGPTIKADDFKDAANADANGLDGVNLKTDGSFVMYVGNHQFEEVKGYYQAKVHKNYYLEVDVYNLKQNSLSQLNESHFQGASLSTFLGASLSIFAGAKSLLNLSGCFTLTVGLDVGVFLGIKSSTTAGLQFNTTFGASVDYSLKKTLYSNAIDVGALKTRIESLETKIGNVMKVKGPPPRGRVPNAARAGRMVIK